MQKKENNIPQPTDGNRRWSLLYCLALAVGILATGILLLWIGDGFPLLAWRQFAPLLIKHAPFRTQLLLVLGQLAFLVAAWVLLFILTIRSIIHLWQHGVALHTTPRLREQHLSGCSCTSDAVVPHVPPLPQAPFAPTSASLPPPVKSLGGPSPPHEDHDRAVSPPLQVPDVGPPSAVPPFQPALFGEPMQLAIGSCSVEVLQQDQSTTAYLLTDGGNEKNASFSWPGGLFALVDHIPRDEPAHTRSYQAIETMRDRVRQVFTGAQPCSDDTLAALVGEQVKNVTRIIGQQSQHEEANPAMAAVLVVGSQLYLANRGDTRVYLCCSQDGLYQISDALGVVHLLAELDRSTARRNSPHPRGKQQGQRRDTSPTRQDHGIPLPLAPGDIVLLCSDGVWSVLHTAYLEHLIRSAGPDPSAICAALVRAVRTSSSTDAVNVIVVHCQGS